MDSSNAEKAWATGQVRETFVRGREQHADFPGINNARAEFESWLAAHDHEVRVEYEKRRKPDPIHVDNIDGQNATQWLSARDEARDREVAARAVEAAQDRLVNQDQFSERTLRILDELAAALRSGTEGSTD